MDVHGKKKNTETNQDDTCPVSVSLIQTLPLFICCVLIVLFDHMLNVIKFIKSVKNI